MDALTLAKTEFLLARIADDIAGWRICQVLDPADPEEDSSRDFWVAEHWITESACRRKIVERFIETAPPFATAEQQIEHEQMDLYVIGPMAAVYADHADWREEWRQ